MLTEKHIILSEVSGEDTDFLYKLLLERNMMKDIYTSDDIPTLNHHKKFLTNFFENYEQHIYEGWYLILLKKNSNELIKVGSIVLKKDGEWGYQILKL